MLIKFLLNGKEINLTSDNVVIESNNFSVDKNGNMTCTNANVNGAITSNNVNITGGKISLDADSTGGDNAFIVKSSSRGWESWIGPGNASIGGYTNDASSGVNIYGRATGSGQSTVIADVLSGQIINQSSLESKKKNFKKLENAIDIIKQVDIYKYNFKSEKDTDKKHIGFVIGDNYKYSKELTSKNNDGADIYSLASCCLQAIKEQQKIIENLQNEIKELKESRN